MAQTKRLTASERDGLWTLLRDKQMPPHIKNYARGALGLMDSQDDIKVMFVAGGRVPRIPCATCKAMPIGVYGDGSPRYAASCSHGRL